MASQSSTPFNKWWPIGTGIVALVLFIIGGGLFGGFNSSIFCDDYGDCFGDLSLWQGGVAMCSLGGVVTIVWIVLLVIYIMRRKRRPSAASNSSTGQVGNQNYDYNYNPAAQMATEMPMHQPQNQPTKSDVRFCGNCGTQVQTPFCPRCGSGV